MTACQQLVGAICGEEEEKREAIRTLFTGTGYQLIARQVYENCSTLTNSVEWEDFFAESVLRFVAAVESAGEARNCQALFRQTCEDCCSELNYQLRESEAEMSAAAASSTRQAVRRAHTIDSTSPGGEHSHLRGLLADVRAELGLLSPSRPTLWDQMRAAFGRLWWLGLVTVAVLILGWYAWSQRTCPTPALIDSYALAPTLVHLEAGELDRGFAYRASLYYAEAAHEELAKLTTESRDITPLYYLAHDYLRLDDYSRAESTFERLLGQAEELTAYAEYQDLDQLRFNQILSRFGMNDDPEATRQALAGLLADPAFAETETGERARALTEELANTGQWWACR